MNKLTLCVLLALCGICYAAPQFANGDREFNEFEMVGDNPDDSFVFDEKSKRPGSFPLNGNGNRGNGNNNNWQQPGNNGNNNWQQPGNNGNNNWQQPGNNGNNNWQQPGNNGNNNWQQPGNNGNNWQQPGNNGNNNGQQPGNNGNNWQQPGNNGNTNNGQQPGTNGQQPGNNGQQPGNQDNNQQNQPPVPGVLSAVLQRCVDQCPTTPEYNPVCGSDNVLYQNPGKLQCSNGCQRRADITISHYGPCNSSNSRG